MRLPEEILGKPIVLLLPGHSISLFHEKRLYFKDVDVYWGAMNYLSYANELLSPIERKADFLIAYHESLRQEKHNCLVVKDCLGIGNSLYEFLCSCIISGVKDVFVFGGDGYAIEDKPYSQLINYPCPSATQAAKDHRSETSFLNLYFPANRHKTNIYNVNIYSKYDPFQKITVEECLEKLNVK